jgi:hypothetical protein
MADRRGAETFGRLFRFLAGQGGLLDPCDLACRLWEEQKRHDFSPHQMECDAALIVLGLARPGVDPEFPEEGETILYGPAPPTQAELCDAVEAVKEAAAKGLLTPGQIERLRRLAEGGGRGY